MMLSDEQILRKKDYMDRPERGRLIELINKAMPAVVGYQTAGNQLELEPGGDVVFYARTYFTCGEDAPITLKMIRDTFACLANEFELMSCKLTPKYIMGVKAEHEAMLARDAEMIRARQNTNAIPPV